MARRTTTFVETPNASPIDDAIILDQTGVAGDLTEILESLRDFDQGAIKGILYKKPANGTGKFEWIEEISPPFDISAICTEMKERFQGGDFQLRVFAAGKIRKNIDFSVIKDRNPIIADKKNDDGMLTLFQILNQQSQSSADRQMQMMMAMNSQSREASDRQMTMMMTMMTAMMGNNGKPTDLIPLIAAMNEGKSNGGMKDMIETMVALKTLVAPPAESKGFDADDLVGSAINLAGPVIGAIGKAVGGMRGNQTVPPTDDPDQQTLPLNLPPPQGAAQQALPPPSPGAGESAAGPSRVVKLIQPDILYFFQRGHDAEKAADAIYDVIEAGLNHGVITEDDLNGLVAAYTISPDWLSELAGWGVDLRTNPEWAGKLLSSLVAIHVDAMSDGNNTGGTGGGFEDHGDHGQAGAPGFQGDEGSPAGG